MTRTISITPTTDDLALAPVFATTPLIITAAIPAGGPSMSAYTMELWKRPYESRVTGAAPLASSAGYVAGSQVTWIFTAAQMDQDLSDQVNSNNYWLAIGGLDANGFPYSLRAGNIEIKPSSLSLVPTTTVSFAVVNEVASFTFNGVVYSFDVVPTGGAPATIDGEAVVIDGMIVVTVGGVSYSVPAVSP